MNDLGASSILADAKQHHVLGIFSDASIMPLSKKAGIAFCVVDVDYFAVHSKRLDIADQKQDIMLFELMALEFSLTHLEPLLGTVSQRRKVQHVILHSDISLLEKGLENIKFKRRELQELAIKIELGMRSLQAQFPAINISLQLSRKQGAEKFFMTISHYCSKFAADESFYEVEKQHKENRIEWFYKKLYRSVCTYYRGVPPQHELPLLSKICLLQDQCTAVADRLLIMDMCFSLHQRIQSERGA